MSDMIETCITDLNTIHNNLGNVRSALELLAYRQELTNWLISAAEKVLADNAPSNRIVLRNAIQDYRAHVGDQTNG